MTRATNPFAKPKELLIGGLSIVAITATIVTATQECAPVPEPFVTLDTLAHKRLEQMEASGVLSHDGFDALPSLGADWRGEVVASSDAALPYCGTLLLWNASPPHKEILDHPITARGFATSAGPANGTYYAVMIVEEHVGEPAIDIRC